MSSFPRPRIVIVDDHPVFREVARELLEELGYSVLGEADCGAAARAVVARCEPDLAVVDIRLGDECGFDVAAALTRAHPSLAVLLTSTDPDAGDRERVARSGARGFVPKTGLGTADLEAYLRRSEGRVRDTALRRLSWRHGTPCVV
jgi:DNA-binding NarL/FixJ family response regulator